MFQSNNIPGMIEIGEQQLLQELAASPFVAENGSIVEFGTFFADIKKGIKEVIGDSRTVKAVSAGYPLRGSLTVAQAPGAPEQVTRDIPAPGEAWVDAPLLDALDLKVGDPLLLGDASLRLARVIVTEPDRGAGFMNFAPRVMINQADIAATIAIPMVAAGLLSLIVLAWFARLFRRRPPTQASESKT